MTKDKSQSKNIRLLCKEVSPAKIGIRDGSHGLEVH